MLETHGGLVWDLLSAILNSLMLPLMIVAILSSIMAGAGSSIGAILADGVQALTWFTFEILLRLFRAAIAGAAILGRLLVRAVVLAYGLYSTKK